jgi:solute carrier family 39 (zinc transporter), member 1/2/3
VFEPSPAVLTSNGTRSSSGLLIYAALVDLLAEDFLSHEAQLVMTKQKKISAFCWVLAGGN